MLSYSTNGFATGVGPDLMRKVTAIGPILQGLNAPINDLSRGYNAEEVYLMSIITAAHLPDRAQDIFTKNERVLRRISQTNHSSNGMIRLYFI